MSGNCAGWLSDWSRSWTGSIMTLWHSWTISSSVFSPRTLERWGCLIRLVYHGGSLSMWTNVHQYITWAIPVVKPDWPAKAALPGGTGCGTTYQIYRSRSFSRACCWHLHESPCVSLFSLSLFFLLLFVCPIFSSSSSYSSSFSSSFPRLILLLLFFFFLLLFSSSSSSFLLLLIIILFFVYFFFFFFFLFFFFFSFLLFLVFCSIVFSLFPVSCTLWSCLFFEPQLLFFRKLHLEVTKEPHQGNQWKAPVMKAMSGSGGGPKAFCITAAMHQSIQAAYGCLLGDFVLIMF